MEPARGSVELFTEQLVSRIERVEVEAIVGGALQKITFGVGHDPAKTLEALRKLDAGAKVHTEFRRGGGFGKRHAGLGHFPELFPPL